MSFLEVNIYLFIYSSSFGAYGTKFVFKFSSFVAFTHTYLFFEICRFSFIVASVAKKRSILKYSLSVCLVRFHYILALLRRPKINFKFGVKQELVFAILMCLQEAFPLLLEYSSILLYTTYSLFNVGYSLVNSCK